MENNLKGMGLFSLSIIHLVSIGKQESFESIEKCIEEGNVVEYLIRKVQRSFYSWF